MDNEIKKWIQELGLMINVPPQAKEPFHVVMYPPQGGGPTLEVVRPPNQNLYIVIMGVGIHEIHQNALKEMKEDERRKFLNELKYDLLKMGVDIIFMPVGQEIPSAIQVSRVLLPDNLTANEFVNAVYIVRNAGLYIIFKFSDTFGIPQGKGGNIRYI
ncbi:DUF2299 domain-containing protein [Acidianus infernus]|jgi:hypothetical protein|uniref:DUF2299 domain-containing protein n=1 Tax=Acidianus infernus TaxID=12915 RepID=UPI0035933855